MMRVAYVCADPGVPVFGSKGCSLHVQEVLRAFCELGASVDLFATRVGGKPPAGLEAVRVHDIEVRKSSGDADRERALVAANDNTRLQILQAGPFDLVYERHALWSYAAMQFAKDHGVPSLLEVNAPLIEEQAKHRRLVDRDLAVHAASRSVTAAGLVVPVSRLVADYVGALGADPLQVMVVPNGVRTERFLAPRYRNEVNDPFRVGFVGSLRPWHAVRDLIDAFAKVVVSSEADNCELVLVGDGPLRASLMAHVDTLPPQVGDQVRFAGAVPTDDVPVWLHSFDVAVAPYSSGNTCYFSPLKLFEYMAAGSPIVAARTGQMIDVISGGVNGLLYEAGDIDDLAAKIDSLRRDPAVAARLGEQAMISANDQHTWQGRVEQMLEAVGLCRRVATPA